MSFAYNHAKTEILKGNIDLANDTLKWLLVGASTTADTEKDKDFLADFTTLDEFTDATYARVTATAQAVTTDDSANEAVFDLADVEWSPLAGDTAKGAVLYKHVTNDSDSIPVLYIDGSGFPVSPTGQTFRIKINAGGLYRM